MGFCCDGGVCFVLFCFFLAKQACSLCPGRSQALMVLGHLEVISSGYKIEVILDLG